jgi:hypothetical protein
MLWNSRVRRNTRANELAELIEDEGSHLINAPDIATYHYRNGTGSSVLDLTIASPAVAREVTNWAADDKNPTGSDHEVIRFQITSLHPDMEVSMGPPRLNSKKTDWDTFVTTLQTITAATSSHWTPLSQNPTPDNLDEWAAILRDSIQAAAEVATPPLNPTPRSKRWWTQEIDSVRKDMTRAKYKWKQTRLPDHHTDFKTLRNAYFRQIRHAKDKLWKEYLA